MLGILKYACAGLLLLCAAFVAFVSIGKFPDSKAVTGAELPMAVKQALVESRIVSKNETIAYYYSEGLFSFVEYGNLFTDTRVVSYELDSDTNERNLYSAVYSDITDIVFNPSEDVLKDSIIEIHEDGELSFSLVVSNELGRDKVFYSQLLSTWDANKQSALSAEISD